MTLNPDATSMLSLFWVVVAVLAQLTNSAAQPAAVLVRKRRAVGFIDSDLPLVQNPGNFCNELLRLEILFLPGTSFAAVIRPFFNQFLSRHRVKGNNCPICLGVYDWTMPDIGGDRDPPPFQRGVRIANQNVRLPFSMLTGLEITAAFERHHALVTVGMPFRACVRACTQNEHPSRLNLRR
jgi:hypothetical protein